jgi:arsenate reductase-like glutaredoxin family protein
MKYTKHFLKKAEDLFAEMDYVIRYERGSFKSGYCIVEDRKIAVINKFFETEARINTLVEILNMIEIDLEHLSEAGRSVYKEMTKSMASEKAAIKSVQEPIVDDKKILEEMA